MHQLETKNTKLLWNLSNKRVVLGLYDAFKQAQVYSRSVLPSIDPNGTVITYRFVGLAVLNLHLSHTLYSV